MKPEQNNNPHGSWLPLAEVAKFTPYSAEYLSLLARKGRIVAKKIDGVWYSTRSVLEDYMQQQALRAEVLNGNADAYRPFISEATPKLEEAAAPIVAVAEEPASETRTTDMAERLAVDFLEKINRHIDLELETRASFFTRTYRRITGAYATVFSSKKLLSASLVLSLLIVIAPFRYVSGFAEAFFRNTVDIVKDAQTVMGFRPGTHENEILLLGQDGEISIFGHIETEGQFRSLIKDGIAPITVSSRTKVENLNADMLDGLHAEELTLAYVTKNGAVTYEPVRFEGTVEVGSTLLVRGATKLLSDLEVSGGLAVLGDAVLNQDLIVKGNATFKDNVQVDSFFRAREGYFAESLSTGGDFLARGDVTLGSSRSDVAITSIHWSINKKGEARFDRLDVDGDTRLAGDLSVNGGAHFTGWADFHGVVTINDTLNLAGALRDSHGSAGDPGYVLLSTGTSTEWVATSSLGISLPPGSGITSLNGETAISQTFATSGANGVELHVTSAGGTHTFAVGIDSAYSLPLSASTTAWNNTTNLVNASSATWTTAFNIVNASSSFWDTAYSWGDHSLAGYLIDISGRSLEELSDVSSMTKVAGDLLYWNGSSWSNIATSSLGFTGGGAVDSVNGQTGVVILDTDDVAEGVNNLYFTDGRADARVAAGTSTIRNMFSGIAPITYDALTGQFSLGTVDVSSHTNLSVSATGLTLAGDDIALTAGYTIPLTASTTDWQTAFSWGDHSLAGYLTFISTSTVRSMLAAGTGLSYDSNTGVFTNTGVTSIGGLTGDISTSSLGITFTETDPFFSSSTAASITGTDVSNWNAAFSSSSILSSFVMALNASSTAWDQAYSWGDHSLMNYIQQNSAATFTNATTTNLEVTGSLAVNLANGCVEVVSGILTSTGNNCGTGSGGITSLNGETGSAQTFATSTGLGLDLQITSAGGVHTFALNAAAGYVIPTIASTTEWDNANATVLALVASSSAWDATTATVSAGATAWTTASNIVNASSSFWDTAYSWGDHSLAGYLTSFTETDPVFTGSAAAGITGTDISNWNTAFSWGNHATAGYLTSVSTSTVRSFFSGAAPITYDAVTGEIGFMNPGYITGVSWGSITGLLADQTDLQAALNQKLSTTTAAATYYPLSNPAGYTSNAGTVTSVGLTVPTGLAVTGSPITTAGTFAISMAPGYVIPLSASTTAWNNTTNLVNANQAAWNAAYASTTALTPSYIRNLFSNTATGLSYNASTGVTSLTGGYAIPLSASTTEWQTAFGWGNHATMGYLTSVSTSSIRGMFSGTAPITYNSGTGAIGFNFATNNTWTGTNAFATTSANSLSVSGTSTLGRVTSTGLTVSGNAVLATTTIGGPLAINVANCNFANSALHTDGSGVISCGTVTGGGASVGGGWTSINSVVRLSTSTDLVGVGTNSPVAKLTVSSAAAGTTTMALLPVLGQTANILEIYSTALAPQSVVTAMGYWGLGTTTPGHQLTVGGDINATGALRFNGDSGAAGQVLLSTGSGAPVWTSTSSLGLTVTEIDPVFTGSAAFGITGGDIAAWNAAYASTTALTPSYIRNLFSNTATGLSYNPSTGVTSLAGGYVIPLSASTTEWQTAFSWGDHSLAGYLTFISTSTVRSMLAAGTGLSYDSNTGIFTNTGVTSIGGLTGDVATSSLGFQPAGNYLLATDNLSDLTSSSTARNNLGLGAMALLNAIDISSHTNLSVSATGLTLSGDDIALTAGYSIPTVTAVNNWNNFYNTPSSRITAGSNLSWSGNTLIGTFGTSSARASISETITGIDYDALSGVFSMTSGYTIPLSASTTAWNNTTNLVTASSSQWGSAYTLATLLNSASSSWNAAAASTTALTPSYIRNLFSNTATGLSYNAATGVTSLAGGYTIPLSASTTAWNNTTNTVTANQAAWNAAYASTTALTPAYIRNLFAAGTGLSYSTSTGTFTNTGVTSIGGLTGDISTSSLGFPSASDLNYWTLSGGNVYRSTGNVGIGTSTPTANLHIAGTDTFNVIPFRITNNTGANSFDMRVGTGSTVFRTSGAQNLIFNTNSTDRVAITASGNVGIGTTTPGSLLTVAGNMRLVGNNAVGLVDRADGTRYVSFGDTGGTDDGGFFAYDSSGNLQAMIRGQGNSFFNGGNVGIGTTSPSAQLALTSATTTTANSFTVASNNNAPRFSVRNDGVVTWGQNVAAGTNMGTLSWNTGYTSIFSSGNLILQPTSGNVGIGTTSPSHLLTVAGDANITGALRFNGNSGTTGQVLLSTGSGAPSWTSTSSLGFLSSAIISLNGQTGATQTFATGTATGIGLSITSAGDVHTFTPTVSSGYTIPLSASTTAWNNTTNLVNANQAAWNAAAASTTALTPAYIRGLWSETVTGLSYNNTTGVLSLDGTHTIPLIASTTQWSQAFASTTALTPSYIRNLFAAGTGLSYNASTGTFTNSGVTSIGGLTGSIATSSLHVATSTYALNLLGFDQNDYLTNASATATYYPLSNPAGYTSNTGTVTSVATNNGITGGTITTTGTIGLTGQALALHNLSTNGLIARTGSGTVAGRTLVSSATGLTMTNGDGVSGNPTISLTSGYTIPLSASTTAWNNTTNIVTANQAAWNAAAASTTALTPSYIRNLFSNTATGLSYNASTGVTSLTGGYTIPLTASTTDWQTAFSWGDHSLAGYATGTNMWGGSLGGSVYNLNSGNVGVGTASPGTQLDVRGANATVMPGSSVLGNLNIGSTDVQGAGVGGTLTLGGYNNDAASVYRVFGAIAGLKESGVSADNAGYLSFGTLAGGNNVAERMRITSAGNIGIGTTSPASRLDVWRDVAGQAHVQRLVNPNTTSGATVVQNLGVFNGNNGLLIEQSSNAIGPAWSSGNYDAYIRTIQSGSKLHLGAANASTPQLTIVGGTGNVGIGTTSPSQKLTVQGNARVDSGTNGRAFGLNPNLGGYNQVASYGDETSSYYPLQFRADTYTFNAAGGTANMTILNNGNVGIGTTTPSHKLTVAGDINATGALRFNGNSGSTGQVLVSNGSGAPSWTATSSLGFPSASDLNYWTLSGGNVYRATGNVGIGTTTPTSKLHVSGGALTVSGNGVDTIISYSDRGIIGTQSNHDLELRTNGLEKIRITASGNVGIGTTTPETKLHIYGSGTATTLGQLDTNLRLQTNTGTVNAGSEISFRGHSGSAANVATYAAISAPVTSNSGAGNGAIGYLSFSTKALGTDTSLTERMRINAAGNVGIGTTSPGARLDVYGSSNRVLRAVQEASSLSSGTYTFEVDSSAHTANQSLAGAMKVDVSSGRAFTINGQGNVGIGVTNPGNRLAVYASGNTSTAASVIHTSDYGLFVGTESTSTSRYALNVLSGLTPGIASGGSSLLYVRADGNVGIGTASPSTLMHLSGTTPVIRLTDTDISASSQLNADGTTGAIRLQADINNNVAGSFVGFEVDGTEHMRVNAGGNVGIGTVAPNAKLEISSSSSGSILETLRLSNSGSGANTLSKIGFRAASTEYGSIIGGYGAAAPEMSFNLPAVSGGNFIWTSNSVERMRLTTAGNVGIGTTSPSHLLTVAGDTNQTGALRFNGNSGTAGQVLLSTGSGAPAWTSTSSLGFLTTVGPTNLVATDFGDWSCNGTSCSLDANTVADNEIDFSEVTLADFTNDAGYLTGIGGLSFYDLFDTPLFPSANRILYQDGSGVVDSASFTFNGTLLSAPQLTTTGATNLATSAGNVGIGTTTPTGKLSVVGNVYVTSDNAITRLSRNNGTRYVEFGDTGGTDDGGYLAFDSSGDLQAMIRGQGNSFFNGGNVGIGLTNPISKLDVYATSSSIVHIRTANQTLRLTASDAGSLVDIANSAAGAITFTQGASTERMRIAAGGNVGIGLTAPNERLEVAGAIRIPKATAVDNDSPGLIYASNDDFLYNGLYLNHYGIGFHTPLAGGTGAYVSGYNGIDLFAGGANRLTITSSGSVGIGTTTPAASLHVAAGGTGLFTRADGTRYVAIGDSGVTDDGALNLYDAAGAVTTLIRGQGNSYFNGGNIGIGTTTPGSKLTVAGSIDATAGFRVNGAAPTGQYLRGNGSDFVASAIQAADVPTLNQNTTGMARYLESVDSRLVDDLPADYGKGLKLDFKNNSTNGLSDGSSYNSVMTWRGYGSGSDFSGGPSFQLAYSSNGNLWTRRSTGTSTWDGWKQILNSSTGFLQNGNSFGTAGVLGTNDNQPLHFETSNVTRMTVAAAGNVGIGTTSPRAKLNVVEGVSGAQVSNNYDTIVAENNGTGGITIATPSSANGLLAFADVGSSIAGYLNYSHVSDFMSFGTNATERLRIDSTGNVGIGTASPIGRLHVHSTDSNNARGVFTASGTGDAGIYFDASDGDIAGNDYGSLLQLDNLAVQLENRASAPINFITNQQYRMTISSGGNVGIGTTTPTQLLHVENNQNSTTAIQVSSPNAGTASLASFYATNNMGSVALFVPSTGYTPAGFIEPNYASLFTDSALAGLKIATNGSGDPIIFGTGQTERMRIDGSGNVGIGTSTPGNPLHVYRSTNGTALRIEGGGTSSYLAFTEGNSIRGYLGYGDANALFSDAATDSLSLRAEGVLHLGSGTGADLTINTWGNVGIGTTSPSAKLHLFSDTENNYLKIDATSNNISGLAFSNNNTDNWVVASRPLDSNNLYFSASPATLTGDSLQSAAKMTLAQSGNVGIGTTSPSHKLTVAGDINATGALRFNGDSGTAGQVLLSTGSGAPQWVATSSLGITGGGGTVTSIATNNGLTGGTITTTGTIGLTGQALALHNLSTNGIIVRTGSGTVAGRTIVASPTALTMTNGDGVSGNPTLTLTSGYEIPLTASTTAWNNFYNTPSTRISAGTNLAWSGNTLNFVDPGYLTEVSTTSVRGMFSATSPIAYNSATGAFSLGTVDISSNTNLAVGNGITLTGDTLTVTAAGGLAQTSGGLTTTGVLEDLNTTGVASAADLFLVSTGAGTMAWENAATARGSMGLGSVATLNSIDISSNTNLSVPATGIELSGDAIALTTGYVIPLSASTTQWQTAYGWGNHASAGYLTTASIDTCAELNAITATTGSCGSFVLSVSPALTGTPTAPTAAVGTNTTQLATTAFVLADAVSANTANRAVRRDASGNFSAGTITAALSGNASTATALQTARTIGGVSFNGTANINLPGVNTTGNQNTTGSAATLTTSRTLWGQAFNGSANVSGIITGATGTFNVNGSGPSAQPTGLYLADLGTTSGTTLNPTFTAAIVGQISTARSIALSVDGSGYIWGYRGHSDAGTYTFQSKAKMADQLTTARTIGGVSFNGTANINLPGVNTAGNQNTSGNAASATILQTARTIGGVSFNGSANINLPGVNTTGNQNTTGSAATLTTARTIGGVSFNGSANINLPGVNTTGNQNTTGSAATLTTSRTIWGQAFNGSANVTGAMSGVTTLSMNNVLTNSNASASAITLSGASSGINFTSTTGNKTITTAGTTNLILSPGGNVGIGTTTPNTTLTVKSTGVHGINIAYDTNSTTISGRFMLSNATANQTVGLYNSAGNMIFTTGMNVGVTSGTERARISNDGSLKVSVAPGNLSGAGSNTTAGTIINGGSNGWAWFATTDAVYIQRPNNSTGNIMRFYQGADWRGSIEINGFGVTVFNTGSDRRVKENISTTTIGLDDLMRLPVRDYSLKSDATHTISPGFIAQELYEVYPWAVTTNGDDGIGPLADPNEYWKVDYGRVTPLLVKSIQDLNWKLEDLATTTPISTVLADDTDTSFTKRFFENVIAWFADTTNGIGTMIAGTLKAKDELCVGDVCVDEGTFLQMVQNAGSVHALEPDHSGGGGGGGTPPPTEPPVETEPEPETPPEEEVPTDTGTSTPDGTEGLEEPEAPEVPPGTGEGTGSTPDPETEPQNP